MLQTRRRRDTGILSGCMEELMQAGEMCAKRTVSQIVQDVVSAGRAGLLSLLMAMERGIEDLGNSCDALLDPRLDPYFRSKEEGLANATAVAKLLGRMLVAESGIRPEVVSALREFLDDWWIELDAVSEIRQKVEAALRRGEHKNELGMILESLQLNLQPLALHVPPGAVAAEAAVA